MIKPSNNINIKNGQEFNNINKQKWISEFFLNFSRFHLALISEQFVDSTKFLSE